MRNVKGKNILYEDWLKVAKFYGGDIAEQKVKNYMRRNFDTDKEIIDKVETFLFNLIYQNEDDRQVGVLTGCNPGDL